MIALYILGAILLLCFLVLFCPVGVVIEFEEKFSYKIKFAGFTVFPKSAKKINKEKSDTQKEPTKNFFEILKDKKGFVGAIKELFGFFADCFVPLKEFLRFVKFNKIKLDLSVTGDDASSTAINYGSVCAVVYPVLSLFKSIANVRYKKIDISADFENKKSQFVFSARAGVPIVFILIFSYKIFKEYKKFSVRNGL